MLPLKKETENSGITQGFANLKKNISSQRKMSQIPRKRSYKQRLRKQQSWKRKLEKVSDKNETFKEFYN